MASGGSNPSAPGLADQTRRLAAGTRAVSALLCTILLTSGPPVGLVPLALLLTYDLWAGLVLWSEAVERPAPSALHPWIDATWAVLMLASTPVRNEMLLLTLVQPVVLATIGQGLRQGIGIAAFAALALALAGRLAPADASATKLGLLAIATLVLASAAALLSRPMNRARQRAELVRGVVESLDARRGLNATAETLVDTLRRRAGADVVAVVLPAAAEAPAVISTAGDGSFRIGPGAHARLEALLDTLPSCPVNLGPERGWRAGSGVRVAGAACASDASLAGGLGELATLLEAPSLRIVPFHRYEHRHGYLLLGGRGRDLPDAELLAGIVPELFSVLEQASLVDRLQAESAAHERARIGRDLHDSAIQPYAGLVIAIEALAMRVASNDPLRNELDELALLARAELGELRDRISGLRSGQRVGDDALVPALRRQAARFTSLFGIEVALDVPDRVSCTRAQAAAVFHMLNETLNNVRQHTRARHVRIRVREDAEALVLVVADDGPAVAGTLPSRFEPRSLTERTNEQGGRLVVDHPDIGTTEVEIRLPRHLAAQKRAA